MHATTTRTLDLTHVHVDVVKRRMARAAGAAAGCLLSLAAMALLLSLALSGGDEAKAEEALALNKELEFAAIQAVLRHLDDNHDGSVDLQESEEFVQMELHETTEKSHRFHETDSQITSEELWLSWQQNEVFYWTNDEVVQWLLLYVELPQYKEVFCKLNITGRHLPSERYLAKWALRNSVYNIPTTNNTGQVLQTVLGVVDHQHKQKIRLRAMDLVLFGPPNGKYSLWKDVMLGLSVTLCVVGMVYAVRQRRETQRRIDTFLESFREKEKELRALQERLEDQKQSCEANDGGEEDCPKSSSECSPSPESEMSLPPLSRDSLTSRSGSWDTSLSRAYEEIELLRREMDDLTSQIASQAISHSILQSLLQESCQHEKEHVERRRREAQDEITRAQRVCDKIKKRRSSLFGTFHLANSSALEEAGLQITRAVNNMQNVSESFEEYHLRWRRIEQVCNFPIISAHHALSFASQHTNFSLSHDDSSDSLQSLTHGDSTDRGLTHRRESLSRLSEGYISADTRSLSLTSPNGSPRPPVRRRSLKGTGSLDQNTPHTSSSSSSSLLHTHQNSCPMFSVCDDRLTSRGRANTMPTTLPRNFTFSGSLSRQESYKAAIGGSSSSINSGGLTLASDRERSRCEEGPGTRTVASGRKEGGRESGSRRGFMRKQSAVYLSAVHEEDGDGVGGSDPVTTSTTHVRGGVTHITTTSLAQSTV